LGSAGRPERSAVLIERGITRDLLRGSGWRRVRRGFYVPAAAGRVGGGQALTTTQRILDASAGLAGDAVFGTWAAAYVLGNDWMDGRDPHTMAELPVDIIAGRLRRVQRGDVTFRFTDLADDDLLVRDGLRVTTACRTAFDGARWADALEDAVVFIDSMLHLRALDLPAFVAYLGAHQHWAGIEQARRAAELSMPDVRSPWESRLRMCWLLGAGLPMPLVNVPLFDESENFLGMGDLFDPESGLIAEFDGDQHRDPEQHRLDNIREEKLESANLVVVRSDRTDLRRHRPQLVGRLQSGYRRGMRRDRAQDTWTLRQPAWWKRRQSGLVGASARNLTV
jgi:hypothetical protein